MDKYGLTSIRNLVLLGHSGSGKTTLSEAVLFSTGAVNRLGKVDEGTTASDFDPSEARRRISISLSVLPCKWKSTKINILDAPGYSDFIAEVKSGIRVSESALIVVSANSGVEVGTEQAWEYAGEAGLSRVFVVNKMDRENADFAKTVGQLQAKFGSAVVPIHVPVGAHTSFQGIADVLTMKSYLGSPAKEGPIPDAVKAQVDGYREKLIEGVAELDDKLLEKYLGGEPVTPEELNTGLKKAIVSGNIVPVLAASALLNTGTTLLLDAIVNYLPTPQDRPVVAIADGGTRELPPTEDGPLSALVFKTSADPYVGKLTYLRVYSGVLSSNSQAWNLNRNELERIGQLYFLTGKNQEAVTEIRAGDIGAVAKLGLAATGDTLGSRDKPIRIVPVSSPAPILSKAVYPKTKLDLDKLGNALSRLVEEDPTLKVHRDPDTVETVISGMGETQLDVAAEKMQRKFGVGVNLETPRVPYKETISIPARAEYKHKKQTGGHGQYGHVVVEVEPLPRGSGVEFVDHVVGGSVPKNYVPAVEKGVHEASAEGVLARYPIADLRVTLVDGSYHPVDSSEICFKIAGAGALKKGMTDGKPVILEPIVNITIMVPEEFTGDIISDLNTKRGQMQGMMPENGIQVIQAQAPLAEVQRYAIDLKSITQGRGTFTMAFSHYQETPPLVVQKIVADRQQEKVAV
jgi:elongation factor G